MYLLTPPTPYIPPAKILDYLLAADHPDGSGKAAVLTRFGFNRAEWQNLAQALRIHGASHEVARTIRTPHGLKFIIEGALEAPDGRSLNLRTVWIILDGAAEPRLVSAYPLQR